MQKKLVATYSLIFLVIMIMMSLSRQASDKLRGSSVAFLAPFWEKALAFKYSLQNPNKPSPFTTRSLKEELHRFQIEYQLLENEFSNLQRQLNEQQLLASKMAQIASHAPAEAKMVSTEIQKSLLKNCNVINCCLKSVPARVIFRSFDSWNNFLWINVGSENNQLLQNPHIAVNSPVIIGKAVIGVIDYVGKHQSRVRLITDNRLNLSVRATRGGEQDFLLHEQIENLLQQIKRKRKNSLSVEDNTHLVQLLNKLQESLQPFKKTWYLAKGELQGISSSSKNAQSVILKGTGFNYDFADEEGENRDLRNGKSLLHPEEQAIPILKVNDVLITTGMDGIFPSGFQVATVTHVRMLKEGDYYYEIEAQPIAGPIEELTLVFVLPPLSEESSRI